jgi:hypothetical protein
VSRAVAVALLASATLATAADPAARARTAASELVSTLQKRLMEELRAGGPAHGIEVCSKEAPAIASAISWDGVTIRRVTTKPRNPANAPDAYEVEVLESMEATHREGGKAPEHEEVVETAGGRELRYLMPIVLAGPCLSCHGPKDSLSPEVRDALAARYPEDRATGYASGDFRGAVSVRVRID